MHHCGDPTDRFYACVPETLRACRSGISESSSAFAFRSLRVKPHSFHSSVLVGAIGRGLVVDLRGPCHTALNLCDKGCSSRTRPRFSSELQPSLRYCLPEIKQHHDLL